MTTQERIARLESLLARVRRNAQRRPPPSAKAAPIATPATPASPPVVRASPEPIAVAVRPGPPAHALRPPVAPQPSVPIGHKAPPVPTGRESMPSLEVQTVTDEDLEVIDEEELLEIAEPAAAQASAPISADIDFEEEEPVPESAPRPAVSLEASLERPVAPAYEAEPPIKTPPPESGRQPLTAPPAALRDGDLAGAADIDALLDADVAGTSQRAPTSGPTMEQLGQTIELGRAKPVEDLELDEVMVAEPAARVPDSLEAPLPGPGAAEVPPPPVSRVEPTAPAVAAPLRPEITARPAPVPGAEPAAYTAIAPTRRPETFLELLDSSLGLRG